MKQNKVKKAQNKINITITDTVLFVYIVVYLGMMPHKRDLPNCLYNNSSTHNLV